MDDTNQRPNFVRSIAVTGLVAGTMDILAATIWYSFRTMNSPIRVLEFISRAAFGRDQAYSGSIWMSLTGLTFHYLIAYIWTCLFYLAYPRINLLRTNKYLIGIGYGIFVWTMMNLVVLPMSKIPAIPFDLKQASIAAFILVMCIGLPISILSHRHYSAK